MSENESVSELFVKEIVNNLKNHHAAVLVGAGFSRNAIRLDGSEKLMLHLSIQCNSRCWRIFLFLLGFLEMILTLRNGLVGFMITLGSRIRLKSS